jgi:hypothetical protein
MSKKYYAIYDDEWISVRNMMNKTFRGGPCELCGSGRCGMVWYSLKTKRVRCFKCFDAEAESIRKSDERHRANWDAHNARISRELRKD